MTSQRYHAAPASDCSIVGVNQTGRSSERRSCSSVAADVRRELGRAPVRDLRADRLGVDGQQVPVGHQVELADREGLAWCAPLSQAAGLSSLVGATASSYDSR